MSRVPVEFDFKLIGPGWAEGRLAIGDGWVEVTASYLGDALGDLLRAVRELTEGADQARASWDEEPGEYRWIFRRTKANIQVMILSFREWRGVVDAPDSKGRPLFDAKCGLSDLVGAIAGGARRVLEEHGSEGYRTRWIEHVFPEGDLEVLERWLSEQ